MGGESWRIPVIFPVIFSFLGMALVGRTLWGTFVFDDSEAIVNNVDVRPSSSLYAVFFNDFWGHRLASNNSHKSYRPLAVITFRLNHWVSGELNPWGFHLVNILLHGIVCYLISHLLFLTLIDAGVAIIASAIFTFHPIHTEVVSGLVGRADLLCAVSILLGLLAFLKSMKSEGSLPPFILSLVLVLTAMLSKEHGIMALGLYSSYEIVHCRKLNPLFLVTRLKAGWNSRLWMQHTLIAASGASLVALRWWAMGFASPIFQPEDNPAAFINSTLQRAINYQYIYTLNSWLMVNPHWLCFDWSMGCIPLINEITDPRVLAPLLFWLITGLLIWRALHPTHKGCHLSRDQRVIMLSLAWVIIPFLPASNLFFTVGFVIAERMLYLPSLGCATLVALGFRRLLSAASASQFLRLVLYGCLSWMLGMYSLKTWERSGEWVSENRLFLSGLRVCPLNAKVHYNIAKTAADSGDGDTAILHYQMALRLNPMYEQAMNNLANLLKDRGHLDMAHSLLLDATRIRPRFAAAWMNLGIVQASLGQYAEAEASYKAALALRARYPDCFYNLGNLYIERGEKEAAYYAWRNATALKPTHAVAWTNLLILLDNNGDLEGAVLVGQEALRHLPDDPGIHFNLGNTLGKKGDFLQSEKHFLLAIKHRPSAPNYYANLGVLYHRWKRYGDAEQAYKKALVLNPGFRSAQENLDKLYRVIAP